MIRNRLLCKHLVNRRPQWTFYSIGSYLADRTQLFKYNFCTSVQSLHMSESSEDVESPELPDWIKFSEPGKATSFDSEDDFVLPKVSEWAETLKLYSCRKGATSMVFPEADSVVDSLSRILKRNFESPNGVLEAVSSYPIDLSETIVMKVLNRFSNDWIPSYGVFKWAGAQRIYRHSADCYNMMVDILGKWREFKLMWDCLEEMKQLPGIISIVTLSKVIRRLSKAGRWSDVEAFRNMERFGLSKDSEVMNIVMDALVKEKCVEKAHEVFLEFKDTIQPNAFTFNILIHGWCKARKFDKACLVMGNMEKDGFHPDIVSYTSFVEANCKEKDFRRVEVMLDEMQKKGCPPNTMTYTIVMLALGKAKEMAKALEVYEKARQEGCLLDSSFYSALIFILNKSGRFKDAQAIFVEMSKQDVTTNVLAYNTMISAACMHSQEEEEALGLLIEMEKKLCKPNLKTYAPLLKMCCLRKRMKVLNYLLNDMFRKDLSPDAGTFTLLANALSKAGKLEHTCSFLEEMALKGMVPMDNTIRLLLEKLEEKGMKRAKQQIGDLHLHANFA